MAGLRRMMRRAFDRVPQRQSEAVARTILQLRSLRGDASYRKFVIVGIARTGSTLLIDLLNAHSQVQAFGELFRSTEVVGWDVRPFTTHQGPKLLALYRSDPLAFLESKVFRRWPAHYAAVGFKLFYYPARQPPHSLVWDYLAGDPSIRVIHMKRANILEQYCSLQLAHKTNVWSSKRPPASEPPPIRLEIEACREHFAAVRAWEEECALLFKSHQIIDLYYEDLVAKQDREMRRIQNLLELRREPVSSKLVRQRRRPLSHDIANYDDLKRAFANTQWAGFFREMAD
jgi:LPS sulfotransferase NodH